jgi:hypothetical protein
MASNDSAGNVTERPAARPGASPSRWRSLVAVLFASVVAVAAVAASIYERSVLHSGKKLGWKEALRRPSEIALPSPRHVVTD